MIKLPKASHSYKTSNDSDFGASFASLYTEDQMWTFAEEYAASSRAPSVCTAMRRYTPDYNAGMNEDLDGDYVLFADARNANDSLFSQANKRIAELEKQAALDKSLLALADARVNRELRDDFAGLAMPGLLANGCDFTSANLAEEAYVIAAAMFKAKGGA